MYYPFIFICIQKQVYYLQLLLISYYLIFLNIQKRLKSQGKSGFRYPKLFCFILQDSCNLNWGEHWNKSRGIWQTGVRKRDFHLIPIPFIILWKTDWSITKEITSLQTACTLLQTQNSQTVLFETEYFSACFRQYCWNRKSTQHWKKIKHGEIKGG